MGTRENETKASQILELATRLGSLGISAIDMLRSALEAEDWIRARGPRPWSRREEIEWLLSLLGENAQAALGGRPDILESPRIRALLRALLLERLRGEERFPGALSRIRRALFPPGSPGQRRAPVALENAQVKVDMVRDLSRELQVADGLIDLCHTDPEVLVLELERLRMPEDDRCRCRFAYWLSEKRLKVRGLSWIDAAALIDHEMRWKCEIALGSEEDDLARNEYQRARKVVERARKANVKRGSAGEDSEE